MTRPKLVALVPMLALTACQSTPQVVCPTMAAYTQDERLMLADEIDGLEPSTVLADKAMPDYASLRAQLLAVGCEPGAIAP
jgi:ABC-type antimicrobial peptide transport system ATPase subunit